MNLETKITIYKFTPQLFTLTPEVRVSGFSWLVSFLLGTDIQSDTTDKINCRL